VWEWKAQYGDTIKRQMIRLERAATGRASASRWTPASAAPSAKSSCALPEGADLPRRVHGQLCPRCHTAISDLEVAHADVAGHLWHIRYPVNGVEGASVTVATTRPETMLGDTAVAVNARTAVPRPARPHGAAPLMDREIAVIVDDLPIRLRHGRSEGHAVARPQRL